MSESINKWQQTPLFFFRIEKRLYRWKWEISSTISLLCRIMSPTWPIGLDMWYLFCNSLMHLFLWFPLLAYVPLHHNWPHLYLCLLCLYHCFVMNVEHCYIVVVEDDAKWWVFLAIFILSLGNLRVAILVKLWMTLYEAGIWVT